MKHIYSILTVWLTLVSAGYAQSFSSIQEHLQEKEWEKARKKSEKILAKNPYQPIANYLLSLYYLKRTDPPPQASLDSAYELALKAQHHFSFTSPKEQKKWKKLGVEQQTLSRYKESLDSLAFVMSQQDDNMAAYEYFMAHYPTAQQLDSAKSRRNELAFRVAWRTRQPDSLMAFIDRYPEAIQVPIARELYETLAFELETRGGTLSEFVAFVRKHPQSPCRPQAEHQVFQLSTLHHQATEYEAFILSYPDNAYQNVAQRWLYRLYRENEGEPGDFLSSHPQLKAQRTEWEQLIGLCELAVYPIFNEAQYGFMDEEGKLVIPLQFDSVGTSYYCEGVRESYLIAYRKGQTHLLDKKGRKLLEASSQHLEDIGPGLIRLRTDGQTGVLHETGYQVLPPRYDSVLLVGERLLWAFKGSQGTLFAPNGRAICSLTADNIESYQDSLLLIRKEGRTALLSYRQLYEQSNPSLDFAYQRATILPDKSLRLVRNGLERIVYPPERNLLLEIDTSTVSPVLLELSKKFKTVQGLGKQWLTCSKTGKWGLCDSTGKQLLSNRYDLLEAWNDTLFRIKIKGKYGLVGFKGKAVLKPEYDGLEALDKGNIATLKEKHFGLISLKGEVKIKPQYEAMLQDYAPSQNRLIARKKGKLGMVNAANEPLMDFRFDEIRYWKADTALVREKESWHFYHIPAKQSLGDTLKELRFVSQNPQELVIEAKIRGGKGLLSNQRGELLPFAFEDITNIGTLQRPFFLAAKYGTIEEVYYLYYFNHLGREVRRQQFSQENYEKIACE
jgi:hypothetical protein